MTRLLIGLVRFYQKFISPLFPPSCRYRPTCSAYMIEALQKHGLKGFLMGLARIGRCHPFVEGGEDPVPDRFSLKRNRQKQGNLLFVLYKYRFLGCLQYSLKRFGEPFKAWRQGELCEARVVFLPSLRSSKESKINQMTLLFVTDKTILIRVD